MVQIDSEQLPPRLVDKYGFTGLFFNYSRSHHISTEYKKRVLDPFAGFLSTNFSNPTILDVASGTGDVAKYLDRYSSLRVVRADLSFSALKKDRGQRVRTLAQQLPFEKESFDAIHMKDALVHFDDQADLYRQFKRVLKPHGYLLITSHTNRSDFFGIALKFLPLPMLLPYLSKNKFTSSANFFESLKIFNVYPPFFSVNPEKTVEEAQQNGFNVKNMVRLHTTFRNEDWTLLPEERFILLFQKVN